MPRGKNFNTEYWELLEKTVVPDVSSSEEAYDLQSPLIEFVKQYLPRRLFRYRVCNEQSIDAFRKNRIYFNSPNNFNDPHDSLVYYDYDRIKREIESVNALDYAKVFEEILATKEIPQFLYEMFPSDIIDELLLQSYDILQERLSSMIPFMEQYVQEIRSDILRTFNNISSIFRYSSKIACFSHEIKEHLMWSYYADSHKGFALEYDFTDFQSKCNMCSSKCEDYAIQSLFPVVYTNHRYDATDFALVMAIRNLYRRIGLATNKNRYTNIPDRLAVRKALTYKATCWKHEKEWRMELHCPSSHSHRNWLACKPNAIYFGFNISELYKDVLIKYAKENDVVAYQMDVQPSQQKYKMNYSKI